MSDTKIFCKRNHSEDKTPIVQTMKEIVICQNELKEIREKEDNIFMKIDSKLSRFFNLMSKYCGLKVDIGKKDEDKHSS